MGNHDTPVTALGLGAMGSALARALVAAGHPTTIWNRTPRRLDGATATPTAAEAVAASPLILVCVAGADVADALLDTAELSGRVVVNFTTTTPDHARASAERVIERGGAYVDGAILAVPPAIGAEAALLLYSGNEAAFAAHRPTLEALGTAHSLGPRVGDASLWDSALLGGMDGMFGGALQAFALVRAAGGTATALAELLVPFLTEMAAELTAMAERVEAGEHPTDSPLAMQAAGVKLTDVSREHGVRPDLVAPVEALIDEGVAAGHGDEDLSALTGLLRQTVAA